jgi:voltage-gated potassium channel Kch
LVVSQASLVVEITSASVAAGLWHSGANALYFSLIAFALLRFIARQHTVSRNVVHAAIVVYVLLAFVWTFIFDFLEAWSPGSFAHVLSADSDLNWRVEFIYFSLVTITTTGYGDIVPISPVARMLATLEALVGQMYLVVMVATIVGLRTVQIVESRRAAEARKLAAEGKVIKVRTET